MPLGISDILLRIRTLTGLTTKNALLDEYETDDNFISIYNDMVKLMTQYNAGNPKQTGGYQIINDVAEANNFKWEVVAGVLTLSYSATVGGTYVPIVGYDMANGKQVNYAYPFNAFYSAIELTDTPLQITTALSATEKITNGTETAFTNTVIDSLFLFADDKITIQNLPTGYSAVIKVGGYVELMNSDPSNPAKFSILINSKEYKETILGQSDFSITPFKDIFEAVNGDSFEIFFKNRDPSNQIRIDFHKVFADFQLIKIFPTP